MGRGGSPGGPGRLLDYAGGIIWLRRRFSGTPLGGMTPAGRSGRDGDVPCRVECSATCGMAAFDAWGMNDPNPSDEIVIIAVAPIDTDRPSSPRSPATDRDARRDRRDDPGDAARELPGVALIGPGPDQWRAVETSTEKYDGHWRVCLDTVEAGVATASSAITDEATARADADGASATGFTAVEAETDDASQRSRTSRDRAGDGRYRARRPCDVVLEAACNLVPDRHRITARVDADAAFRPADHVSCRRRSDGAAASVQTEATVRPMPIALASSIATPNFAASMATPRRSSNRRDDPSASADVAQAASLTLSLFRAVDHRCTVVVVRGLAETAARSTADDRFQCG